MSELLTLNEAAQLIGLYPTSLRFHIVRGHILARRFGRRVLMLAKADVERFIADRAKGLYVR